MITKKSKEMLKFIEESPTAFHAIYNLTVLLKKEGFSELLESDMWSLKKEGRYFVTRNHSSIIAFAIGKDTEDIRFRVTASHSDSPSFKVKENAEITIKDEYMKLNTEGYGGMICASWIDRPLSLAGRALVKTNEGVETRLFNIERDLLMIPGVAIHLQRKANEGIPYNKQIDMLPVLTQQIRQKGALKKLVAESTGCDEGDIYGMDTFLYNRGKASVWGLKEEFISSPRLDDLQCAYASLQGFLSAGKNSGINVFACFDNEEVGSSTKQGAASSFLSDVLWRISYALGKTDEDFRRFLASGFMLSCDNAHAVHPNHPEMSDTENGVYMNKGVVFKIHAGQKYTSDAVSIAIFREICERAGVPIQFQANRSDMEGGSTLGNIAMTRVSMNCIDIGLAQWSMHSAYETAGAKDTDYMIRAVREFYNSRVVMTGDGKYVIESA